MDCTVLNAHISVLVSTTISGTQGILRRPVHLLKTCEIDGKQYRDAMAHFAGHVHVVTTDGAAGRRGVTVIAACSVSDDPPTVLVCLSRGHKANECYVENGVFALNTLARDHRALAEAFSGATGLSQDDRFALTRWDTQATGAPVLCDAVASFDCRITETRDIATHRILIGKVAGLRVGDGTTALLYHNRAYQPIGSR